MSKKCLVALAGPTASGKTALAIKLAQYFNTEIISVDARQLYKEIDIGTAKPDTEQLSAAKHHFISCHSIFENVTAAKFGEEARKLAADLFKKNDIVIAVGGSTLYFKAFLDGLDDIPEVNAEAKVKAGKLYAEGGIEALQKELQQLDIDYYNEVDRDNPRRIMRALEVIYSSGKPFSFFRKGNTSKENHIYNVVKIGLDVERGILYDRINNRCDEMLAAGLLEEVKSLYPHKNLQALQTVGYTEFFDFLDGMLTYNEAVDKFKQHTRNYAKRQLTWFRKDAEIKWFSPDDFDAMVAYIEKQKNASE